MWPFHRNTAKILQGNNPLTQIVQLPGRQFPALAVQGDTLLVWTQAIRAIAASAKETGDDALLRKIAHLQSMLEAAFDSYNQTCKKHRRGGFP